MSFCPSCGAEADPCPPGCPPLDPCGGAIPLTVDGNPIIARRVYSGEGPPDGETVACDPATGESAYYYDLLPPHSVWRWHDDAWVQVGTTIYLFSQVGLTQGDDPNLVGGSPGYVPPTNGAVLLDDDEDLPRLWFWADSDNDGIGDTWITASAGDVVDPDGFGVEASPVFARRPKTTHDTPFDYPTDGTGHPQWGFEDAAGDLVDYDETTGNWQLPSGLSIPAVNITPDSVALSATHSGADDHDVDLALNLAERGGEPACNGLSIHDVDPVDGGGLEAPAPVYVAGGRDSAAELLGSTEVIDGQESFEPPENEVLVTNPSTCNEARLFATHSWEVWRDGGGIRERLSGITTYGTKAAHTNAWNETNAQNANARWSESQSEGIAAGVSMTLSTGIEVFNTSGPSGQLTIRDVMMEVYWMLVVAEDGS